MTTIIVTNEDNQVSEFEFKPTKGTVTLGRRSTNDVCIPDLSISGKHAIISFEDGKTILEDLNSTNGSYVNGQVVQRSVVQPDDEIILGKVLLSIITDAAPVRSENDVSDTDSANSLHSVPKSGSSIDDYRDSNHDADSDTDSDTATAVRPATTRLSTDRAENRQKESAAEVDHSDHAHPLDGLEHVVVPAAAATPMHELDSPSTSSKGAVIEIRNGAKSGQILPIDKPVTTLGRPGIQIAAIMRKPDGYFLMHIESDDNIDRPTLNSDTVGDEPVLLHSGDELTVAGIDVAFMLS